MRVDRCRINHLKNPLGFALDKPVLSWVAACGLQSKGLRALRCIPGFVDGLRGGEANCFASA